MEENIRRLTKRAELFYPGDGVVDSLLAPRGSTTKRLKESDLVVTQPNSKECESFSEKLQSVLE
ncbi:hypothetical protein Lal_00022108 [Lupinus albus]|nr:hypothetical protein Lal_00022108 [Lupinus albus]